MLKIILIYYPPPPIDYCTDTYKAAIRLPWHQSRKINVSSACMDHAVIVLRWRFTGEHHVQYVARCDHFQKLSRKIPAGGRPTSLHNQDTATEGLIIHGCGLNNMESWTLKTDDVQYRGGELGSGLRTWKRSPWARRWAMWFTFRNTLYLWTRSFISGIGGGGYID